MYWYVWTFPSWLTRFCSLCVWRKKKYEKSEPVAKNLFLYGINGKIFSFFATLKNDVCVFQTTKGLCMRKNYSSSKKGNEKNGGFSFREMPRFACFGSLNFMTIMNEKFLIYISTLVLSFESIFKWKLLLNTLKKHSQS